MRLLLPIILFLLSSLHAESGILEIKWPQSNLQQQKPLNPYPTVLTNGIKDTLLPIYIPSSYAYDTKMIVVADKNFYTISFFIDKATVMMAGDKTFQESISISDSKFQKVIHPSPIEFLDDEGIMSIDFNRHGVNYTLSIECDDYQTDKRCKEEVFLKNLYNRLIMVGGKQ
jgi:hypothetical protein